MLPEQRLLEKADGIRKIVLMQSFDARELKNLLLFDVVVLEARLLQDLNEDVQRLIDFSTQALDQVTEKVRFIDNLYSRASVLQAPGDIFQN